MQSEFQKMIADSVADALNPQRGVSVLQKWRWRFIEDGEMRNDIACLCYTRDEALAWYKQTHGVDLPEGMTMTKEAV